MAEPMIDVYSVTVQASRPCSFYGDIFAYDKFDLTLPKHVLYQEDVNHAFPIMSAKNPILLSVTGLDRILFMQQPVISFNLKVKDCGDEDRAFIAHGNAELDIETDNDYEEFKVACVEGNFGQAKVKYVALSCALVAHLTLRITNYQQFTIGNSLYKSQQDSERVLSESFDKSQQISSPNSVYKSQPDSKLVLSESFDKSQKISSPNSVCKSQPDSKLVLSGSFDKSQKIISPNSEYKSQEDSKHVLSGSFDKSQKILSQQDSDLGYKFSKSKLFKNPHSAKVYLFTSFGKTFTCPQRNIPLLAPIRPLVPLFCDNDPTPTVNLTRNYLAVPAYSSLNIKVGLVSPMFAKLLKETHILQPNDWRALSKFEYNDSKKCENVCSMWISWKEPINLKPSSRQTKRKSVMWGGGEILFELFSVFIGRQNDHDLKLSGTITLEHDGSSVDIFNRDESNPDKLLDGRKLLTITCPSSPEFLSASISLTINVELKDADQRFLIEEGSVDFDTTVLDGWDFESQFDRLLCSVLQGGSCFCAVHYTMFKSAARVSIKVVLLSKGVDVAKVHGKIVAWSDIFDYTRGYDQKYYRRVLFDEPYDKIYYSHKVAPKKAIQSSLEHGEFDLSESCVAVPVDFRYNIAVDLYPSSHTGSGPEEHVKKTYSFKFVEDKLKFVEEKQEVENLGGDFELYIQTS